MWFSPMFKKTTKVKLPCIFLSFTAVVNKERLIKIYSDLKQKQALENNGKRATQSTGSDANRSISFTLTHDWCLHKTALFNFSKKPKTKNPKALEKLFCVISRAVPGNIVTGSLQCWDYIAERQHCETGMLCIAFQTHCLEGDWNARVGLSLHIESTGWFAITFVKG